MKENLIPIEPSPTGMRLNEWVAQEEKFFEKEGLDVQINWNVLRRQQGKIGTTADTDMDSVSNLLLGKLFESADLSSACAWGGICMAGAGVGKFVRDVYGVSPYGIYVLPDSDIHTPEDLKDRSIAVGLRAGSHFSALHHLEKYLPLENINVVNFGGFGQRLQAVLNKEADAASLLPPQNYMAEQLGLRAIITGEFKTTWWVNSDITDEQLNRYFRAMDHAEEALNTNLAKYLHLWEYSVPAEFKDQKWDYGTWGRGEQFVRKPISQEEFNSLLEQAQRWKLDNHMTDHSYENLAYSVS